MPKLRNTTLVELNLQGCFELNATLLQSLLRNQHNLQKLNLLSGPLMTSKEIDDILKQCSSLKSLSIGNFNTQLCLKNCTQLQTLVINARSFLVLCACVIHFFKTDSQDLHLPNLRNLVVRPDMTTDVKTALFIEEQHVTAMGKIAPKLEHLDLSGNIVFPGIEKVHQVPSQSRDRNRTSFTTQFPLL